MRFTSRFYRRADRLALAHAIVWAATLLAVALVLRGTGDAGSAFVFLVGASGYSVVVQTAETRRSCDDSESRL